MELVDRLADLQGLFFEWPGTCSRQLVSRRWRLSSPTTLATANGTNPVPWVGS